MPPAPPVGVVFDYDGTLVRSMELHAEAYRRALAPYGVRPSDAEVFRREGARSETILQGLLEAAGHRVDAPTVQRLADEKQRIFAGLGPPAFYAGAAELVRAARSAGARIGLVTGTRRENLERVLADLVPLFDAMLAAGEYEKDKPDPDPYARTAGALGLNPSRCAAVENAVLGVRSAKAAGFAWVLAVPTTMRESDLRAAGAHDVAPNLEAATLRLGAWIKRTTGGRTT